MREMDVIVSGGFGNSLPVQIMYLAVYPPEPFVKLLGGRICILMMFAVWNFPTLSSR